MPSSVSVPENATSGAQSVMPSRVVLCPLIYPVAVPVSRKRKKSRKASRKSRPQTYALRAGSADRPHELTAAMTGFAEYRRQLDERRASLAAAAAEPMIAELVGLAATRSDSDLEDELCVRIGRTLAELDDAPIDDHVGPNVFAEAVIDAAVKAVGAVRAGEADGWTNAWRVLAAVTRIVNYPLRERAMKAIDNLRAQRGGRLLPERPTGPTVIGSGLSHRDAVPTGRTAGTCGISTPAATKPSPSTVDIMRRQKRRWLTGRSVSVRRPLTGRSSPRSMTLRSCTS